MAVFSYRSGRSIKGIEAQHVGEELERLRAASGVLTPSAVVEAARNAESPLHAAFTWDDSEAAEAWRLTEARRLITSIKVFTPSVAKPMPAFVSVRTPELGRGYMATVEAMAREDTRDRVLMEAIEALESLRRRYGHFVEIADALTTLRKAAG